MAKEYKSKFGGGKIDALLNHLDEGLSQGKDLSTNDYTTEDKSLVEGIPNKPNKEGYYKDMSVGMADNLIGRGDVQDAHINFRPSAGADNITDGAARIERIKGNSVVWNQLAQNADFRNGRDKWWSTLFTFLQENDYVVLETTGKGSQQITQTFAEKIPANHKILIICDNQRLTDTSLQFMFYLSKTGVSEFDTSIIPAYSSTQRRNISTIINTTAEVDSIRVYPIQQAEAGTKVIIYSIRIIDLTKEFGAEVANNITSYEDYLQLKPLNIEDEYAYNAGTLVDMKVDSLISTSDNAYDYVKGYARVMGGQTYDCSYGTAFVEKVYFSTNKDNIVVEENAMTSENGKYTFPSDGYAVPYTTDGDVREYCVCLQHTYTKPHPPYQQEVKDLSFISEAFPNGMRSAGSAFDEILYDVTKKKWLAVKRVGAVDLGSLTWQYKENYQCFNTVENFFVPMGNGLTSKYSTRNVAASSMSDLEISFHTSFGTGKVLIKDLGYTDAQTFKTELQGVILNYELAEPIVVELNYPTAETNMDYMAWDFGTEEAIATKPSAPFRADIVYDFNATDDIRSLSTKVTTLETKVNGKQDKISVTTKSNGNIVLLGKEFMPATPSGDPMHYAYEAAGCVYNPSTGLWSYREEEGGLIDLTNEDMKVCYAERWGTTNTASGVFARIQGRTVLNNMLWTAASDFYNSVNACPNLEVFFIKGLNANETYPRNLNSSFYNCPKLHTIGSPLYRKDINLQSMTTTPTNCFALLPALRNIYLRNVKVSLSFADSPLISKESLLYMIENCASNAPFTITLHPDVYAKCTDSEEGAWYDDIVNAIDMAINSKDTRITLASA